MPESFLVSATYSHLICAAPPGLMALILQESALNKCSYWDFGGRIFEKAAGSLPVTVEGGSHRNGFKWITQRRLCRPFRSTHRAHMIHGGLHQQKTLNQGVNILFQPIDCCKSWWLFNFLSGVSFTEGWLRSHTVAAAGEKNSTRSRCLLEEIVLPSYRGMKIGAVGGTRKGVGGGVQSFITSCLRRFWRSGESEFKQQNKSTMFMDA